MPQIQSDFLRVKSYYRFPPVSASEQLAIFPHLFSFTFVRHPLVRLASTYQDKVVDHDYAKWREKILKDYALEANDDATRIPSFR